MTGLLTCALLGVIGVIVSSICLGASKDSPNFPAGHLLNFILHAVILINLLTRIL